MAEEHWKGKDEMENETSSFEAFLKEPVDKIDVLPENIAVETVGKRVPRESLERTMRSAMENLVEDGIGDSNASKLANDTRTLLVFCQMIWNEKEEWKHNFREMADRYNKHLDKEIESLRGMLPRSRC